MLIVTDCVGENMVVFNVLISNALRTLLGGHFQMSGEMNLFFEFELFIK